MCRDTLKSGRPFTVHCWDLVFQRKIQTKKDQTRWCVLFRFFMAPEATSMAVTAKWNWFLLKVVKQKITQLSQKLSAPTPTAASGQNSHLLHVAKSYVTVMVSVPLNCFSQAYPQKQGSSGGLQGWVLTPLTSADKLESTETAQKTHLSFLKKAAFLTPAISLKTPACAF